MTTETDHVGIVLGVGFGHMPPFQAGFEQGVRHLDPVIKVDAVFLTNGVEPYWDDRGFSSPTLGQIAAGRMFESGADVVFGAAGYSNIGVHEAAAAYTETSGNHVWSIGADGDEYLALSGGGPEERWRRHILTSIEKRINVGVELLIEDIASGGTGQGLTLTVANGAFGYSTSGGYIEEILASLDATMEAVSSGDIVVDSWPETMAPSLVDVLDGEKR
jgi:basic membrane protein A